MDGKETKTTPLRDDALHSTLHSTFVNPSPTDDNASSCADDDSQPEENEDNPEQSVSLDDAANEEKLRVALGILPVGGNETEGDNHEVVDVDCYAPNPDADTVDLSLLRGVKNIMVKDQLEEIQDDKDTDLSALAELVPGLIDPETQTLAKHALDETSENASYKEFVPGNECFEDGDEKDGSQCISEEKGDGGDSESSITTMKGDRTNGEDHDDDKSREDIHEDEDEHESQEETYYRNETKIVPVIATATNPPQTNNPNQRRNHYNEPSDNDSISYQEVQNPPYHIQTSAASISTVATHEVRMPMYLPTFKPATGCTNASDFIVRCFVARLRAGITVVKHGRSRWCKSRLRILHVHADGRSLSWKPAIGEPSSNKRPPKLDLSTCREVRHAWSSDPLNPMFTGTPILRQKCEAANAHKSFALIFPKRTVDITAITADQCKVLMEGFSALCFRLQVANLATKKDVHSMSAKDAGKSAHSPHDGDNDERSTVSNTLTNNSTMSPTVHVIRRSAYR